MKKLSYVTLLIGFVLFLGGCSQGYRSNAQYDHTIKQQQAAAKYRQQQQAQARINAQRAKQLADKRKAQASYLPKQKPTHASQQTHSNAVVSQHPARNRMTQIAHSTVGVPYKWGGNNPQQGFDCSGLMSYVHKNALGINIPRTAAQQRDSSRTINYSQLQAGDMLFFKTGRDSNHVGVYIGNRKFVHAATGSKQVKIASMDSSYWHQRFVKFGTFL